MPKKVKKWAVSPRPGPHKKFESIPLQVIVRDILKVADTGTEARGIIKKGEILVDGKKRKDHAYPAGLFDVIVIPALKQVYRIVPIAKGLGLVKIPDGESNVKICKIKNKTVVRKGKVQLNLHDGRNILVDNKYKVGDSILIELPTNKINAHIPLSKNSIGVIYSGKNSGKVGIVKEILAGKFRQPKRVMCDIEGSEIEVNEDSFIVVGKEKPLISLS